MAIGSSNEIVKMILEFGFVFLVFFWFNYEADKMYKRALKDSPDEGINSNN